MGRANRIWQRVQAGHVSISFREFVTLVVAFGFRLDRVAGSHHIFWHDAARARLNIQNRGGAAKDYHVRQFVRLVEEAGLSLEDER